MHGVTGVDPFTFQEEPANRGARSLGSYQDDVDVLARNDAGLVGVNNAKSVREIQGLARCEERLEFRPLLLLARIGKEVLDNSAATCCLVQRKERLSGNPS